MKKIITTILLLFIITGCYKQPEFKNRVLDRPLNFTNIEEVIDSVNTSDTFSAPKKRYIVEKLLSKIHYDSVTTFRKMIDSVSIRYDKMLNDNDTLINLIKLTDYKIEAAIHNRALNYKRNNYYNKDTFIKKIKYKLNKSYIQTYLEDSLISISFIIIINDLDKNLFYKERVYINFNKETEYYKNSFLNEDNNFYYYEFGEKVIQRSKNHYSLGHINNRTIKNSEIIVYKLFDLYHKILKDVAFVNYDVPEKYYYIIPRSIHYGANKYERKHKNFNEFFYYEYMKKRH